MVKIILIEKNIPPSPRQVGWPGNDGPPFWNLYFRNKTKDYWSQFLQPYSNILTHAYCQREFKHVCIKFLFSNNLMHPPQFVEFCRYKTHPSRVITWRSYYCRYFFSSTFRHRLFINVFFFFCNQNELQQKLWKLFRFLVSIFVIWGESWIFQAVPISRPLCLFNGGEIEI